MKTTLLIAGAAVFGLLIPGAAMAQATADYVCWMDMGYGVVDLTPLCNESNRQAEPTPSTPAIFGTYSSETSNDLTISSEWTGRQLQGEIRNVSDRFATGIFIRYDLYDRADGEWSKTYTGSAVPNTIFLESGDVTQWSTFLPNTVRPDRVDVTVYWD